MDRRYALARPGGVALPARLLVAGVASILAAPEPDAGALSLGMVLIYLMVTVGTALAGESWAVHRALAAEHRGLSGRTARPNGPPGWGYPVLVRRAGSRGDPSAHRGNASLTGLACALAVPVLA